MWLEIRRDRFLSERRLTERRDSDRRFIVLPRFIVRDVPQPRIDFNQLPVPDRHSPKCERGDYHRFASPTFRVEISWPDTGIGCENDS